MIKKIIILYSCLLSPCTYSDAVPLSPASLGKKFDASNSNPQTELFSFFQAKNLSPLVYLPIQRPLKIDRKVQGYCGNQNGAVIFFSLKMQAEIEPFLDGFYFCFVQMSNLFLLFFFQENMLIKKTNKIILILFFLSFLYAQVKTI